MGDYSDDYDYDGASYDDYGEEDYGGDDYYDDEDNYGEDYDDGYGSKKKGKKGKGGKGKVKDVKQLKKDLASKSNQVLYVAGGMTMLLLLVGGGCIAYIHQLPASVPLAPGQELPQLQAEGMDNSFANSFANADAVLKQINEQQGDLANRTHAAFREIMNGTLAKENEIKDLKAKVAKAKEEASKAGKKFKTVEGENGEKVEVEVDSDEDDKEAAAKELEEYQNKKCCCKNSGFAAFNGVGALLCLGGGVALGMPSLTEAEGPLSSVGENASYIAIAAFLLFAIFFAMALCFCRQHKQTLESGAWKTPCSCCPCGKDKQ